MATRLWFCNGAPGFTPTTIRGTWHITTSAITGKLGLVAAGTATTRAITKNSSTNPRNCLWGRWISDPIAKTGTLSGVCNWVLGVVESSASANAFFQVHVFVTAGDTDTVRGTLLSNFTGTTEFGTSAAGLGHHDQAISSLAVTAGDRIVVEIGWQGQNTSTLFSATMNYGNNNVTGVRIGGTNVTTQPGWIQFSDPNNVIAGDFGNLRRNYSANPAAGADLTYWAAANATLSRITGQTQFSRSTAVRATLTTAPNPIINTPRVIASVGESWMCYVEYKCSASRTGDIYLGYLDATGSYIDFVDGAVSYSTSAFSTWFDLRTAPANTIDLLMSIEANDGVVNDTFDVSCTYYDKVPFVDYRDGSFPNWVWEGTTDDSVSHQLALPPPKPVLVDGMALMRAAWR